MNKKIPHSVLFIERNGDIRGGGHISLVNILRHIDKELFKPYLVCSAQGSLREKVNEMGIASEIIEIKSLKRLNIFSLFIAILKLCRLIRRWDIKIVHSNAGSTRDTLYSGVAARLAGIPFIWHVRVIESGGIFDRLISLFSTKIIVISEAVKRRFHWIKNPKKLVVIPNGVDIKRFNPSSIKIEDLKKEFGFKKEDFVIGTVGQLIPWKGINYLIDAFYIVRKENPEVKLLIVGDEVPRGSGYRKKLEEMVNSLDLKDEVVFTGFKEDIPEIMGVIDIFVLPSINEPFGRVLIEAMSMEKPVVATKGGGVPEIVVDGVTGILVPLKDPEAMAKAVLTLIRDKKLAIRMGKSGRERVEKFFTIEEHLKRIQEIYLELINRK
jgi:glycosyltransferase involved in cell wall biosynthesis